MPTNTAGTTSQLYTTKQVPYLGKAITFADNGKTISLGIIPAGSFILRGGVAVFTAFNAGTTNTLNIGTVADDDGFATLLALGTIGIIQADEMATTNDALAPADMEIIAKPILSGTAATAGSAYVWVEYITPLG